MTTAAKAYLSGDSPRVICTLELVRDLLNSDLRQFVDVTDRVMEFDQLGGDSTLRNLRWKRPGMTPTLQLSEDGYLTPGHADSLWTSWGLDPDECYIRFKVMAPLPSGTLEVLRTYYGEIVDSEARMIGNIHAIALVTIVAIDRAMSAKISKASGDESVYIGNSW
jgi:hypothetical protein